MADDQDVDDMLEAPITKSNEREYEDPHRRRHRRHRSRSPHHSSDSRDRRHHHRERVRDRSPVEKSPDRSYRRDGDRGRGRDQEDSHSSRDRYHRPNVVSKSPVKLSFEKERAMRELRRMVTPKPGRSILPEPGPDAAERDSRTVMVMQVGAHTSERDIEHFFLKVGQVEDVRMISDRNSRRSKGIAYVEFTNEISVALAIAMSGQRLSGQPVMIQATQAEKNRIAELNEKLKKASLGPTKVYISDLHSNIDETMIKAVLEPFGLVETVDIVCDPSGKSRGTAIAEFKDPEAARQASEHLNGFVLAGKTITVTHVTDNLHLESLVNTAGGMGIMDLEDIDRTGIGMTSLSRANLMAKLSLTHNAGLTVPGLGTSTSALTAPSNYISSCFVLENMFIPNKDTDNHWDAEVRDDVLRECMKFGHTYHIHVDKNSQGNIYVKAQTPSIASSIVNALTGKFFSGRLVKSHYIPELNYHSLFPTSLNVNIPLKLATI
eukprot:TRINITY_DN1739_c0_g1_i1.p1 TRINITY_DN1739_c0_g1~~TRINITY_DN1739_c0_g1_i1.p1  ORF type:complete len:492 (+),score=113.30 TRINITY_DN1739_c0_g1_i1:608-2083(+)